ncbi:MAG: hypothetical protein ACK56I_06255, partial [bacterium]
MPSLNFRDFTWVVERDGKIVDPYQLLPKLFQDVDTEQLDLLSEGDCADGKLHCRPTVSTKPRRSIDAAAIIEEVFNNLKKRDPYQAEFHQAAQEVLESLVPVLEDYPELADHALLE